MRKRNSVKQLNRVTSHRKAMLRNMATSLIEHERIITTRAKGKVIRAYTEKLITRAKKNTAEGISPETALHNKREVMKDLYGRDAVAKLFEELAPRYKDRNGGYTRMIHMQDRKSDSSKMSIVELVDRKEKERKPRSVRRAAAAEEKGGSEARGAAGEKTQGAKTAEDDRWYKKLMKKKKGE
jgi:large subunit ribosomal protein L17